MSGITTAATIWAVAAISIGAGYYFAAAAASVLIIFVLAILPYTEDKIDALSLTRVYIIIRSFTGTTAEEYETLMLKQGLKYKRTAHVKENGAICITWEVRGHANKESEFSRVVANDETVKRFEF